MSMPEKSFEPGAPCPLDGVRVIDMSRLVSGNMVSLQLADFGAEVLKIEDPKRGDPLRAWQTNGISVHWKVYSRNKKSMALSLREPRGRELFLDLVGGSQTRPAILVYRDRSGDLPPDWHGAGPHRQPVGGDITAERLPDQRRALHRHSRLDPGMAERLFRTIGREDMITDPRFRTNTDRIRNAEACEAPIVAFIGERALAQNMEVFERAEVTAAPVYDIDQFMADPHVIAREILVDVPDAKTGRLPMHNVIPRFSATPGRLRRPAPELGEHTAEILESLGLGLAEIEALAREEIIRLAGDAS